MALKFRLITICLMAIAGAASAIDVSKQGNSAMEGTYFASPYQSKGSVNPYTDDSGYVNPYRSYPGPAYNSPSWPRSDFQPSGKRQKQQTAAGTNQSKTQAGAGTSQSKTAASVAGNQAASTALSQTRAVGGTVGQGSNRPALDANGLSRPSVLKQSDKIGTTKVQP